jgi:hypothetical protein
VPERDLYIPDKRETDSRRNRNGGMWLVGFVNLGARGEERWRGGERGKSDDRERRRCGCEMGTRPCFICTVRLALSPPSFGLYAPLADHVDHPSPLRYFNTGDVHSIALFEQLKLE